MPVYAAVYPAVQPVSTGLTRSPSPEPEHGDAANGHAGSTAPAKAFPVHVEAPLSEALNVRASSPAPPAPGQGTYTVLVESPQVEAPHGIVWATVPRQTPRAVPAGRPN